jgi:malonyl-CoA O-methyltransferase
MRRLQAFFQGASIRRLSSLAAYQLWADSYPAYAHNPLMEIEERAMRALLPELTQKTVLDLACGSGRYTQIALELGAARVYSMDNSLPMLRAGQLREAAAASLDAIPLPDASVDVIVCGLALGHVAEIGLALREMSRVMRRGSVALISDFHPYQALRGARRTFSAGGSTYEVEHYVHLFADYFTGAQQANLRIDAVAEPALPERGPVVLALRLHKAL